MKSIYSAMTTFFVMLIFCANSLASVPNTLSYQGTLTDKSGNPITATKTIDFKLYDVVTGGTALWTETQTVTVSSGRFGVVLGVVTPFDSSILTGNTWIGVTIQGETEMTPRQKLTSVAYAHVAGKVLDQSVTAASIGEPCSVGQTLVKTASGWTCGNMQSTLFKPQNFPASAGWQYTTSATATNTTVLTSGNYTVPDGVYFVTVEAIGGGGGGGGCNCSSGSCNTYGAGGGGGAGEYAGTYLAVTPGSTISISYGAAGVGGANAYDRPFTVGSNGGSTIITYNSVAYVYAHGGIGGMAGGAGGGGTGSSDLIHKNGATGAISSYLPYSYGGPGGSGPLPTNIFNSGGNGGDCTPSYLPGSHGTAGAVAISYVLP